MEYKTLKAGDILEAGDELKDTDTGLFEKIHYCVVGFQICETDPTELRRPISEVEGVEECDHVVGIAPDDRGDLFEVYSSSRIADCNLDTKYKHCRDCGVKL